METGQAVFFEDNKVTELRKIDLEEKRVCVAIPLVQELVLPIRRNVTPNVGSEPYVSCPEPNGDPENNNENPEGEEDHHTDNEEDHQNDDVPPPPPLVRRSQRDKKKAISEDYVFGT